MLWRGSELNSNPSKNHVNRVLFNESKENIKNAIALWRKRSVPSLVSAATQFNYKKTNKKCRRFHFNQEAGKLWKYSMQIKNAHQLKTIHGGQVIGEIQQMFNSIQRLGSYTGVFTFICEIKIAPMTHIRSMNTNMGWLNGLTWIRFSGTPSPLPNFDSNPLDRLWIFWGMFWCLNSKFIRFINKAILLIFDPKNYGSECFDSMSELRELKVVQSILNV